MTFALQELFKAPQNNLRLFKVSRPLCFQETCPLVSLTAKTTALAVFANAVSSSMFHASHSPGSCRIRP